MSDQTPQDSHPQTPPPRKAPSKQKDVSVFKWVLGIGGVLIGTTVIVIALFGPAIASVFVRSMIEERASAAIAGEVRVGDVGLSWSGPQRLEEIELIHPDGASMGTFRAMTDAGLIDLASGGLDLGTLTIVGDASLRLTSDGASDWQAAIAAPDAPPPAPKEPGERTPAAPQAAPLTLPAGLTGTVDARLNTLTIVAEGGETIILRDIDLDARLDAAGDVSLTLAAKHGDASSAAELAFLGPGLVQQDGTITLAGTGLSLRGSVSPERELASLFTGTDALAGASFDLVERDGRLVPRESGDPMTVWAELPPTVVRVDGLELQTPISVRVAPTRFALPLPEADNPTSIDWSEALLDWVIAIEPLTAEYTDGTATRVITTDTLRSGLTIDPIAGTAALTGATQLKLDGVEAGTLGVGGNASGIIDQGGRLAPLSASSFVARLELTGLEPTLIGALVPRVGDAGSLFGGETALRVEAAASDTGASGDLVAGTPTIRVELTSPATEARATFALSADGLRSVGTRGIAVRTTAAGPLLAAALGPEAASRIEFQREGQIETYGVAQIPFVDGAPDLTRLTARATLGAAGVTMTPEGGTAATIDSLEASASIDDAGNAAWTLSTDITTLGQRAAASGSGNAADALSGAPTLSGTLDLEGLPVGLLVAISPEITALGVETLGPALSGRIETTPAAPAGTFDIDLAGDRGSLATRAALAEGVLRVLPERGLTLSTERGGAVLSRALALAGVPDAADFERSGAIELRIDEASAPLASLTSEAVLQGVSARGNVRVAGVRADAQEGPIEARELRIAADLSASGDLALALSAQALVLGEALSLGGTMGASGLHTGDGVLDFNGARWSADVSGALPASASRFIRDTGLRRAVDDATEGRPLDLRVETNPNAARNLGGLRVRLTGADPDLLVQSLVGTGAGGLWIGDSLFHATLSPAVWEELVAPMLAGSAYERVRLVSQAPCRVRVPSFVIPMPDGRTLDLDAVRSITASVSVTDPARFTGLPSTLGIARATDIELTQLRTTLTQSLGPRRERLVRGNLSLRDPLMPDAIVGIELETPLPLDLSRASALLTGPTRVVDGLLGAGGRLSDAFGSSLEVELTTIAEEEVERAQRAPILGLVRSEHVRATVPLRSAGDDRYELAGALRVQADVQPAFAQAMLLSERALASGARVSGETPLNLTIDRVDFADGIAPTEPGGVSLAGTMTLGTFAVQDGAGQSLATPALAGTIESRPSDGAILFTLDGTEEAGGPAAPGEAPQRVQTLTARGVLAGALSGTPLVESVVVEGALPALLIDAIAGLDGALVDLTGPRVEMQATATGLGTATDGGAIDVRFASPSVSGTLTGPIDEGAVLALDPGSELRVTTITQGLSDRYLNTALPLFSSFVKTPEDRPAVLSTQGLRVPLDGNVAALDGTVRVDMGTLRFQTEAFFGRILELTNNNAAGGIGKRMQPFDLRIDEGVFRYDGVVIPVGEFDIVVDGRVNLKSQRINTLVFIPAYALSNDLSAVVDRVPGVSRLTMVPIRVRGPIDSPDSEVDLEALFEGIPNAIGGTAEDLLNDLFNGLGGDRDRDRDRDRE